MLQYLISGLSNGSAYALIAIGLVLILKGTDVPNFALAEIGLLAAFIVFATMNAGVPYYLAVLVGLIAAAAIGVVTERLALRPLAGKPHTVTNVMTLGLLFVFNSLSQIVFGLRAESIYAPYGGPFQIFGQVATREQVASLAVGAVAVVALGLFFRTIWGIYMRAVAMDSIVPRLLGVRYGLLSSLSWAAASVIGGLGVLLYAQTTVLSVDSGGNLIFNGFVAATLGGFTSIPGAFLGGLVLGILEELVGAQAGASAELAFAMVLVLVVLVIRPQGVLGEVRGREV